MVYSSTVAQHPHDSEPFFETQGFVDAETSVLMIDALENQKQHIYKMLTYDTGKMIKTHKSQFWGLQKTDVLY